MSTRELRDHALAWINAYPPTSLAEAMLLEQLRQVCERAAIADAKPYEAPRATGWADGMDEMAEHAVEMKGRTAK